MEDLMHPSKPAPTRSILLISGIFVGLALLAPTIQATPQFPNPVFPVGSNPYGMTKADFDGDGIDDLMVSNFGSASPPGELSFLRGLGDGTFAAQVKIPLSNDPVEVFSADFNGDGRPDLAVSYLQSGAFLFNQGQAVFGPEAPLPTILSLRALQMGDFSGDGLQDLVVYGDFSGQHFFQVLFPNGSGFFAGEAVPAGTYNFHPGPFFYMRVADFTGDGKDDIAAITSIFNGTSDLLIYPSQGNGTFLPPFTTTVQGNSGQRVFPAELNGDGRMDLVFTMFHYLPDGSGQVDAFMRFGRGDGTFDSGPTISLQETLNAIVASDLNRDGVQDFIDVNDYDFRVYLGLGDNNFAPQPIMYVGNGNVQALLGDFQRDGLADLALLSNGSDAVFTFAGNGDGSFGPAPIEVLQYVPYGALGVGDLNGDGNLDLAAGRVDTDEVSVLLGNGDGSFGPEARIAGGVGHMALGVADFDADGRMDIAEAVLNWPYAVPNPIPPGTLLVSKGNGDGTFAAPVPYEIGPYPVSTAVADFNGDGAQDVAVVDFGDLHLVLPDLRVFMGNPGGPLTPIPPRQVPSFPSDMDVGDFNLDGHPDLVVTTRHDGPSGSAVVLLGNGDGTFRDPTLISEFTFARSVDVADLNRDGKPDLVVADSADSVPPNIGAVHVFLGQGDGTFAPGVVLQAGNGPYGVTLGDFNGDSLVDLFVENVSAYQAFFPGLGDGTFGPQERYGLFGTPIILGSFDFNGDHLNDLIAFSDMGVFVIERQGAAPRTQVLDARIRFSPPRAKRKEFVEWSTDQEAALSGFNLIALSPGGQRRQLNTEPIDCAECTTGRGHSYSILLDAPGASRAIYIEVLYLDGHSELFGPAAAPPRFGGSSSPAIDLPPKWKRSGGGRSR
jgi:hypothetical protein